MLYNLGSKEIGWQVGCLLYKRVIRWKGGSRDAIVLSHTRAGLCGLSSAVATGVKATPRGICLAKRAKSSRDCRAGIGRVFGASGVRTPRPKLREPDGRISTEADSYESASVRLITKCEPFSYVDVIRQQSLVNEKNFSVNGNISETFRQR